VKYFISVIPYILLGVIARTGDIPVMSWTFWLLLLNMGLLEFLVKVTK